MASGSEPREFEIKGWIGAKPKNNFYFGILGRKRPLPQGAG
jgi:hypothetical protein